MVGKRRIMLQVNQTVQVALAAVQVPPLVVIQIILIFESLKSIKLFVLTFGVVD